MDEAMAETELVLELGEDRSAMAATTPKPFVFVLMPFSQEFNDVYKLGIGPACKEAGAYCERVDEQVYAEGIMERVYNQIAKADIIVSDMTGQNPNVFYETGYAHALGKLTVLLTRNAGEIPFDLRHLPHIAYRDSISSLKRDLKKKIRYFVDRPDKKHIPAAEDLEFYVNGQSIAASPSINVPVDDHERNLGWTITIGIHNKGKTTIDMRDLQFGFVWPTILGDPVHSLGTYSRITSQSYMVDISTQFLSLLPEAWTHKAIQVLNREIHEIYDPFALPVRQRRQTNPTKSPLTAEGVHHCAVRIFTALGKRELPFTIWVK
jgi:hypothetical protein